MERALPAVHALLPRFCREPTPRACRAQHAARDGLRDLLVNLSGGIEAVAPAMESVLEMHHQYRMQQLALEGRR